MSRLVFVCLFFQKDKFFGYQIIERKNAQINPIQSRHPIDDAVTLPERYFQAAGLHCFHQLFMGQVVQAFVCRKQVTFFYPNDGSVVFSIILNKVFSGKNWHQGKPTMWWTCEA